MNVYFRLLRKDLLSKHPLHTFFLITSVNTPGIATLQRRPATASSVTKTTAASQSAEMSSNVSLAAALCEQCNNIRIKANYIKWPPPKTHLFRVSRQPLNAPPNPTLALSFPLGLVPNKCWLQLSLANNHHLAGLLVISSFCCLLHSASVNVFNSCSVFHWISMKPCFWK